MNWKHNAYKGKRAFVFGTGPSLTWEDPGLIRQVFENEFTVGMNGLFLWQGMVCPPTVVCMIDHPAFPMWCNQWEARDTFRVAGLREGWPEETPKWHRVLQRRDLKVWENWNGDGDDFDWFAGGANVLWTLVSQMVFWLGFDEMILLGCDGWSDKAPFVHSYELKDYFTGKIERTPSPVHERTQLAARKASMAVRDRFKAAGRMMVNTNSDNFLPKMEYKPLKEVLS